MPEIGPRAHLAAAAAGACGALALSASVAVAQTFGYTASLNGVRGSYPTERVDGVYVFNSVDITGGPVRVAVTVPWMRVETAPSDAIAGSTGPTRAATNTGIGDPLIRLDLRVVNDRARSLQLGVAAGVKLPVVGASTGRGTGETDYAVGANGFKTIRRTSIMADALFWKYGDPSGADLTDTWSYSVGAAQVLGSGRWSVLASIAGFSAGVGDLPPPVALNIGILTLVGRRQSLAVTASIGLNDSSSDVSVGTSWRISR